MAQRFVVRAGMDLLTKLDSCTTDLRQPKFQIVNTGALLHYSFTFVIAQCGDLSISVCDTDGWILQ